MPFAFTLPTTSSLSFSSFVSSPTHPSLPLNASTQRGVLRAALKKHKRLPPWSQGSHLSSVVAAATAYLPYLLAVADAGRPDGPAADVQIVAQAPLDIEWRPTLADPAMPGMMKERPRVKIGTLDYEVYFVLSTLANAYTLMARSALHPLYDTSAAFPQGQARTTAITAAGKHLRDAAEVYMYLSTRAERYPPRLSPPCPDVAPPTMRALSSLALAEATLLAVLKDDPYPAVVAQERSKTDTEWMYKAPSIPRVRAHLFARLCLGASEQAAEASSLCVAALGPAAGSVGGRISEALVKYLDNLRSTSRAKACRFFGIDAELGGEMGTSLGWLNAALCELGAEIDADGTRRSESSRLSFGRFKREWAEKREEKRIEKETMWGMDAGRLEETRVVEMLHAKWSKINDTINTQKIPPLGHVVAQMPSGRSMYSLQEYQPPLLEASQLELSKAQPDRPDDYGHADSSDEDEAHAGRPSPVVTGAFPGPQRGGRAYY